jgi:quinol monooxygenase YgiN
MVAVQDFATTRFGSEGLLYPEGLAQVPGEKAMNQDSRPLELDRRQALLGAALGGAGALGFLRATRLDAETDSNITQTATFSFDVDRTDEVRQMISTLVAAVEEKEPGVLAYMAYIPVATPDKVFFFEIYADEAAAKSHGQQPHLAVLGEAFQSGLFKPPVDIAKMNPIAGFKR